MIAAIETHYKGYRFRSRLEARWAVFFEAAGIEWLYEYEGYVVNGQPYLPDFYLPEFGYFEVKGVPIYDRDLLQDFANEIEKPVFVAVGEIPYAERGKGYLTTFIPSSNTGEFSLCWGFDDLFLRCDGCGGIRAYNENYYGMKEGCCDRNRIMPLDDALLAARRARFEHGRDS